MDGMVAAKVQDNKRGNRRFDRIWQIDKDVHLRPIFFAGKVHGYLLASGQTGQRLSLQVKNLEGHILRLTYWRATIDIFSEKLEYFRPTFGPPCFGVGHPRSVGEYQWIWQGVFRDFLLGIVGLGALFHKFLD